MHMGVAVRLTLFSSDRASAERAATAAFSRFAELDDMMSDYQWDSELNRLCRQAGQGPVEVSPEMYKVLSSSVDLSVLSNGAFDVTAAPVVKLWRTARTTSTLPTLDSLSTALDLVDFRRVRVIPETSSVALAPDTTLDLGGIAKGFACDEALSRLIAGGVTSAMVEAGGDVVVSHPPPDEEGWSIKVSGQDEPLILAHAAVSTSSDEEQFVEIDGVRYSHIVDPRTGMGLDQKGSVTMIGDKGCWTDPLATAEAVSEGTVERIGNLLPMTSGPVTQAFRRIPRLP